MNVYALSLFFFLRTTDADEHFVAYKVHLTKTETLYYTGYSEPHLTKQSKQKHLENYFVVLETKLFNTRTSL